MAAPRTLTQMFRERDDPRLVELLLERPDLAVPDLTGFSQLASRATTRHSVGAAVDQLNAFELWVAGRVSALSSFEVADLAPAGLDPGDLAAAVERLLTLGLVWGGEGNLRPVRALSATLGSAATLSGPPPSQPPTFVEADGISPATVTKVAAGSAFEFVRRMDVLVEHCDQQPVRLIRSGGVAQRNVRVVADLLDVRPTMAATYLELARASGLLGISGDTSQELLMPSTVFDSWQAAELADQWVLLAETWLDRHPASGPGWVKRLTLAAFGDPADGLAVPAGQVAAWLDWQRPRRPSRSQQQVVQVLDQASALGVTGLGALASYALPPDATPLSDLLPGRVGHILVQADLTAIAPGPLTAEAAHDIGAMAEIESRGGATVYRFTVASLQRARKLGWSTAEMLQTLEERSQTALPQPLRYLVADLDRPEVARPSHVSAVHQPPSSGSARPVHRAPLRGAVEHAGDPSMSGSLDIEEARAIVVRLRVEELDTGSVGASTATFGDVFDSPLTALREAVETREVVWCGYVDAAGLRTERLVKVVAVDEGLVEARDATTEDAISLPLRRITAAHILRTGS